MFQSAVESIVKLVDILLNVPTCGHANNSNLLDDSDRIRDVSPTRLMEQVRLRSYFKLWLRSSTVWLEPIWIKVKKSWLRLPQHQKVNIVRQYLYLEVLLLSKFGSERGDFNWCRFWASGMYFDAVVLEVKTFWFFNLPKIQRGDPYKISTTASKYIPNSSIRIPPFRPKFT